MLVRGGKDEGDVGVDAVMAVEFTLYAAGCFLASEWEFRARVGLWGIGTCLDCLLLTGTPSTHRWV